ncbi:hypothetical protein HN011_001326 [Eciton burchellii]|nr:hypothetical protein HN011_001326 [Eciton burchellii]
MLVYFIEVIRDGRNVFNHIADCGTILQIIIRATVRNSQEFTSTKNRIGESSWKTGVLSLSEARVNPAAHVARRLQIRKRIARRILLYFDRVLLRTYRVTIDADLDLRARWKNLGKRSRPPFPQERQRTIAV